MSLAPITWWAMLSDLQSVIQQGRPTLAPDAVRGTSTASLRTTSPSSNLFTVALQSERRGVAKAENAGASYGESGSQIAGEPSVELLRAVRGRALAVGLDPSDRVVYQTAIRDLRRQAATTASLSPAVLSPEMSTQGSTNPNQPGGAGYVDGGSTAAAAPSTSVDMSGPSPDTQTYTQQLFTLEADPGALASARASGAWPAEATNDAWRRQTLIQFVAAEVGTGPHYNPTTQLTRGQVISAQNWASQSPALGLNPTYAAALERAAMVASQERDNATPLPWSGLDMALQLNSDGSYGTTPVSGYYGTGLGAVPTA